eukprot:1563064-Rhodomonas_salina.1
MDASQPRMRAYARRQKLEQRWNVGGKCERKWTPFEGTWGRCSEKPAQCQHKRRPCGHTGGNAAINGGGAAVNARSASTNGGNATINEGRQTEAAQP